MSNKAFSVLMGFIVLCAVVLMYANGCGYRLINGQLVVSFACR